MAVGDQRLLYLSWLTGVQAGLVDDAAVEPPCPPGLNELPATLQSFVDFAWLDTDLVAAAAEASQPLGATSDAALKRWIELLGDAEKTRLLLRVIRRDGTVGVELSGRFRRENSTCPSAECSR